MSAAPSAAPSSATILVIAPRENSAETLRNALRAAGENVTVAWLEQAGALGDQLTHHDPALIACAADDSAALDRILGLCVNAAPRVPLIALADARRRTELLRAGARDAVDPADPDLLELVLTRHLREAERMRQASVLQAQLADCRGRLDALIADSREARAVIDDGIFEQVNDEFASLFGFPDTEELAGVPLMDLVHPDDRPTVKQTLKDCAQGTSAPPLLTITGQRMDDSPVTLSVRCRPATGDQPGRVELLVTPPDETAPVPRDPITTGRQALYQALQSLRPHDAGSPGLLCLHLDDFAGLQDRLGPAAADRIADEVFAFTLSLLGDSDHGFRLAAPGLALLMHRENADALTEQAETIREAIAREAFGEDQQTASVTASIAVAALAADGDDAKRFLRTARLALQLSDRTGNQVDRLGKRDAAPATGVESEQPTSTTDRAEALGAAIANDQLALAYLEITSLEGDTGPHYDALLRWNRGDGRPLRFDEFREQAEAAGLLSDIDRWATTQVLARTQGEAGGEIFLPLSAASVQQAEAFAKWLGTQARGRKDASGKVWFVLQETDVAAAPRQAQTLASACQSLGLGVAIDGYANHPDASRLAADLRAGFVRLDADQTEILVGDGDEALTQAVAAARAASMRIVAGHVQDANSMARLWQHGINFIQGRRVHEPDTAEA
ncbi:EAL domain-containing protein [Salinisphaera sp. P385]|uniref:EAL domain-containing protein n=1 Tax=Spectribacter acetivorans TaxID=3075603 RepID=A0ABU3B390_9GAMM|nr:EAL domain-containing protein [Salinisphaera sp. P385]MDT0616930.1 EAL domain-containing protein [Salinisphaera sp. P385]